MYVSVGERALLEQKILTLEQRLHLVERFVEMRFCETFRDFSVRNLPNSKAPPPPGDQDTSGKARENFTTPNNDSSEEGEGAPNSPDHSPPSSPPAPIEGDDNSEENSSVTTYRTRSGRKTKRLTATALRGGSRSGTTGGGEAPPQTAEPSSSKKILRVTVTRVDVNSAKNSKNDHVPPEEEPDVDSSIIKQDFNQDDDYLEFPSGSPEDDLNAPENDDTNDQTENDDVAVDPDDQNSSGTSEEEDDDDNDFSPKTGDSTSKTKKTSNTSKKGKTAKKKKHYHTPSRIDLLPEGSLQLLRPDQYKECPICHQHRKLETFGIHMQSHVKERNFQCRFCDKRFFRTQQLRQHERIHQIDKYGRKCRLCEKVFINSVKVLYHERACIRKKLEAEESVDPAVIQDVRERSQNAELNWPDPNEKVPEGTKKCKHCKRYIAEDLFQEHLTKMHATWKCNFCEMKFVFKSGLVRHLCRSHGENRITCERCKKTFEGRDEVRSHNAKCKQEYEKKMRREWVEGKKVPKKKVARIEDDEEEEEMPQKIQEEIEIETQEEGTGMEVDASRTEPTTTAELDE